MACVDYPSFWRRAGRAALSNPRSMVLTLFGLACFAAGIIWGNDTGGTGLLVVGSGILCLGVLLPTVQEAQIGTEGFSFKKAMQQRDDDFRPFVETQQETLQRLTVMLTGDPQTAEMVVNDTLAHAYGEWSFVLTRHRGFYLVCSAIRRALGALKVGLAVPSAGELPAAVRPLFALSADARAAARTVEPPLRT